MRSRSVCLGLVAVAVLAATSCTADVTANPGAPPTASAARLHPGTPPLVIAHRGASGYRPEETLAAYTLAAQQGADYLELDCESTSDGVLVARHENELSQTTDVADHPEFAGRKTTKVVDGVSETGWFTEDFTLAELKTLRAKERIAQTRPANAAYDGQDDIPTLAEVLALRAQLSSQLGRPIGVYIETKHPTYFSRLGLSLEPKVVAALDAAGLSAADPPVFLESFELSSLLTLREAGTKATLVLLTAAGTTTDLSAAGLRQLQKQGIGGIGPDKAQILPDGAGTPTSLVRDAHAAGLLVHPYTFRAENQFLSPAFRKGDDPDAKGDAVGEQVAFLRAGVDGLFTDEPDIGVQARARVG